MSDLFIQEIENIDDILSIQHLVRSIKFEFCRLINEIHTEKSENQKGKNLSCLQYANLFILSLWRTVILPRFSSQSYLGRIFLKETGMTLQQYHQRYKIREFINP